ncbi:TIGR02391 family protein [Agromyces sp. C10]|uniref:TIGR02391 family protein n=1 Tax=Agromyces sp. C10 TaxID=2935077 RepID=UPI00200B2657|nr:TIGR02391 family protein [Agromyces sp. C10]MCK8609311.1 TIGR02391 family protein [Agromyces sp. C10]
MSVPDPLVLRFDPQTVDHLGAKMYSHLPNAVAELVANAYDADASQVNIVISADGTVEIRDDGHGMSRTDISDKYLRIGRNRRQTTESTLTESGRRQVSGKKGLGKLALFGIGRHVTVSSTRAGSTERTTIELDYAQMMDAKGEYRPFESSSNADPDEHGTSVLLSALKRTSAIDAKELAASLSRLFNYVDSDFAVAVIAPDGARHPLSADLRLSAVEVEFVWEFPSAWTEGDEFGKSRSISGTVVSSASPLRHGMRGITIYVNGRLANEPEFFGASESSYAFSYLSGYLDIDYLDSIEPDVIATDRRAIDWETPETEALRRQLQALMVRLGQEWRVRRAELKRKRVEKKIGEPTEAWVGTIKSREQESVRELVSAIESDAVDMSVVQQSEIIALVKKVAPPYAEYVWRHLHPDIQDVTRAYYEDGNYYIAVQEAMKRFVKRVRERSGAQQESDFSMLGAAFGDAGLYRVFRSLAATHGFSEQTEKNVENGQKHMSMGMVAGFRNPLAHEEIELLRSSGAFTNDDCLDALSIVSHLMRRLDAGGLAAGS